MLKSGTDIDILWAKFNDLKRANVSSGSVNNLTNCPSPIEELRAMVPDIDTASERPVVFEPDPDLDLSNALAAGVRDLYTYERTEGRKVMLRFNAELHEALKLEESHVVRHSILGCLRMGLVDNQMQHPYARLHQ